MILEEYEEFFDYQEGLILEEFCLVWGRFYKDCFLAGREDGERILDIYIRYYKFFNIRFSLF